ncbi:enoyl-CoA hydratase/isomerase family protein [Patulibacter sp. SYSU D01012]|uniref:enoyl-CoA hydratase/isomerase family protein n=1 Tax=Patulibacter sp. SYSU D01012 TaxID=2817381 RepID=UPI001B30ABCA|nr:enoyl-CoA hydratase/isomerase family protein [Patulibacter sp. SYSU D01012]
MTDDPTQAEEVLVRTEGALGHLTLNRPKAINALTIGMIRTLAAALDAFERDPDVRVVAIDGAGERGLCAGGDIVALHDSAKQGTDAAATFWREEYELNARIASYPKPIVALMDGVVMGGGIGLAGHASHRLATERLISAMPEVGIGFTPDVGGTWLLSRGDGELGTYLALTGARLGAHDAIAAGLADRIVAAAALPTLLEELRTGDVDGAIERAEDVEVEIKRGTLSQSRRWINQAFAHGTVEEIVADLRDRDEPDAQQALAWMEGKSPTSLKVTLRALRRARELPSLEAALDQEFRVSTAFLSTPDFVEGIRAQVVDKDRNPQWSPATLDGVDDAELDRYFAPSPAGDLGLAQEASA